MSVLFLYPPTAPIHYAFTAVIGEKYGPSAAQRLEWVRIDPFGTVSVIRRIDIPENSSAQLSPDGTLLLITNRANGQQNLKLYGQTGAPHSVAVRLDRAGFAHVEISPDSRFILVSNYTSPNRKKCQIYSRTLQKVGQEADSEPRWTAKVTVTNQNGDLTFDPNKSSFRTKQGKQIPFRPYSGINLAFWADKDTFLFSGSDYSGALKPRHYSVLQQMRWNPQTESFGPPTVLYRGGSGYPEGDPALTFPAAPIGVLDGGIILVDTNRNGDKILWIKDRLPLTLCELPPGNRGFLAVRLIAPLRERAPR